MFKFQKQYEAYLLRTYGNRLASSSVTGDSGVASTSHVLDDKSQTIASTYYQQQQQSVRVDRRFQSSSAGGGASTPRYPDKVRSSAYQPSSQVRMDVSYIQRNIDDCKQRFHNFSYEPKMEQLSSKPTAPRYTFPATTSEMFKTKLPTTRYQVPESSFDTTSSFRPSRFFQSSTPLPDYTNSDASKGYSVVDEAPKPLSEAVENNDDGKASPTSDEQKKNTEILENELERYISKIRNLHKELEKSVDEGDPEQNTSGDLLNVTLSEDDCEQKSQRIPEDLESILALADNLASIAVEEPSVEQKLVVVDDSTEKLQEATDDLDKSETAVVETPPTDEDDKSVPPKTHNFNPNHLMRGTESSVELENIPEEIEPWDISLHEREIVSETQVEQREYSDEYYGEPSDQTPSQQEKLYEEEATDQNNYAQEQYYPEQQQQPLDPQQNHQQYYQENAQSEYYPDPAGQAQYYPENVQQASTNDQTTAEYYQEQSSDANQAQYYSQMDNQQPETSQQQQYYQDNDNAATPQQNNEYYQQQQQGDEYYQQESSNLEKTTEQYYQWDAGKQQQPLEEEQYYVQQEEDKDRSLPEQNVNQYYQGQYYEETPRQQGESNVAQAVEQVQNKGNDGDKELSKSEEVVVVESNSNNKKKKDVIKSILESDTESSIEHNVTNTESDFDFS